MMDKGWTCDYWPCCLTACRTFPNLVFWNNTSKSAPHSTRDKGISGFNDSITEGNNVGYGALDFKVGLFRLGLTTFPYI